MPGACVFRTSFHTKQMHALIEELLNSTLTGQRWTPTSMNPSLMFTFKYIYKQSGCFFFPFTFFISGGEEEVCSTNPHPLSRLTLPSIHSLAQTRMLSGSQASVQKVHVFYDRTLLPYMHLITNTQIGVLAF